MEDDKKQPSQVGVNINAHHTPILYTDTVFMSTNEDGVTLDVGQKMGPTNQLHIVSRIGMSREHAKKFVKKLSELLALSEGNSQTGDKN